MPTSIPAELIKPDLDKYCADRQITYAELSRQMGFYKDTLGEAIRRGQFSFNLADHTLCKLGNPLGFWLGTGAKYYAAEFAKKCKRAKCKEMFQPHHEHQKYCSVRCKKYAARDRWNGRHKARSRANNARRMRAARKRDRETLASEELELRRIKNRIYKRKWRERQRAQREAA